MAVAAVKRRRFAGGLPLFEGLLPLDKARIPTDVIAGATLAALAIPEVMGYTKIAGTPVVTGLYTILIPILLFAIFGSSRHLVVGADSATAAIMATALAPLAAADSTQYVALASTMALLAAGFLILARLLRLGFIANFLSRAVLIGFLTGVGFQVAIGQVPGLFGLPKTGSGPIEYLANTVKDLGSASWLTFGIAMATLAIIVGLEKVNKRIPGALIAVVGMIVLSAVLDWQAQGVSVLGSVPGGLPNLGLPQGVTTQDIWDMLPTAFSIFIVILAQSAATSRAYAMRYNDSFNENVDLVGLSMASLGAGLSGTFVVNGSPTKTEMVDHAGGRSQLAQLTCGAVVLIVLLFLTKPLEYMPNAVLAAVVFLIGIKLIDLKGMRDIATLRRGEFWVAAITAIVVVFVGVEQGIVVAMVLSIIEHLYHSYRPRDLLMTRDHKGEVQLQPLASEGELQPGLLVYRFGATLYYANSSRFTEEIVSLIEEAKVKVRWLGLSGSAIADVDYQGGAAVAQLVDEFKDRGVTVALVDLAPAVRSQLDAFGLIAKVGPDKVFESLSALETAYAASPPPAS